MDALSLLSWVVLPAAVCWSAWRLVRFLLREWHGQQHLVARVNRELPQTQCGKCGHQGCLPYAKAIVEGAPINRCPPGGHDLIVRLATLLGEEPVPLDPAHGRPESRRVAIIREEECIGCKKCIRACPVDAILGAAKQMHTVIASECTGCDLCVDPCPVDCIDMIGLAPPVHGPRMPGHVPNPLHRLESAT